MNVDYVRTLQILGSAESGSMTVRSPATDWSPVAEHPWSARMTLVDSAISFAALPPRFRLYGNSRFPVGRNDGAVWQGRGLTAALDVGLAARWRDLSVTFRPTLMHTRNERFELAPVLPAGLSVYAYPWRVIDLPQRFGPDPFWTFDWGQSEVRSAVRGVSVGVSTANLWWGPGIRNAIVMSDNAPGFPHAFVGTSGPVRTGIGELEARWIWGRLEQSEWFDPTVDDDRFLTGIVIAYSPSFLEGLTIGGTRVFYSAIGDGGVPIEDYFAVFTGLRKEALASPENPTGDDEHDQLLSLFGRWIFPADGFEIWGEWSRNDHSWKVSDFFLEPEHSQGYTFGLQKAMEVSGSRLLSLGVEFTHLERSTTLQVRETPTYYTHSVVTQGYTQRGQIIGAGIGPGGNSQYLGANLYAPWGKAGVYVERQVHDNDAYYAWAEANDQTYCCHDVSFHLGAETLFFVGDFDLGGGFIATREYNRYFFGNDLWNLNLAFSARWRPS